MIGRNDPCPCGSGKKYKKCCESKETISIEKVKTEELERVLQTFYDEYPERKDYAAFGDYAANWIKPLKSFMEQEMIEAIAMDEFFFHQRQDIWTGYLEKQRKKIARPSTLKVLDSWNEPRAFVGVVTVVEAQYLTVQHILTNETILLRRENDKPVPTGMHVYCFVLPDGQGEDHYLAVSSLVFFPTDHKIVFEDFTKEFKSLNDTPDKDFLKENGLKLWIALGKNGYQGGEYTFFEAGVLQQAMDFLERNSRDYTKLIEVVEDYLFEQQPNARKEVAIAAGAIRFGQEKGYFNPLDLTVKEIAETFEVSTSSLNKYYNELISYYDEMKMKL